MTRVTSRWVEVLMIAALTEGAGAASAADTRASSGSGLSATHDTAGVTSGMSSGSSSSSSADRTTDASRPSGGLSRSTGAWAGTSSTGSMGGSAGAAATEMQQATGQVERVDPALGTVAIRPEGGTPASMLFVIDANRTNISREKKENALSTMGRPAALNLRDLQPGDAVQINYIMQNGKPMAQSIVISADASRG